MIERSKQIFILILTFMLLFVTVPFSLDPNRNHHVRAAGLLDLALLSGQDLDASYNATTNELRLRISGLVLLNLGALTEQHFYYRFPTEFRDIMELPNFKEATRVEFRQNLLLGLVPIAFGTLKGDDLTVTPEHTTIEAARFAALDVSVASNLRADLIIDLDVMGISLPEAPSGTHRFFAYATKSPLVNLSLLGIEGASDFISMIQNDDLTANPVTDKDSVVTGIKKRSTATSVRVFRGGTELGRMDVGLGSNKPYSVPIPVQSAGTVLTVQAYNGLGVKSGDALTLIVQDATAPDVPLVNPVTDQDAVLTGTGEAGTQIEVASSKGEVWTGTVAADGTFSVAISAQKADTVLAVTLTDAAGNESEPASVIVMDTTPPEAPLLNDLTDDETEVSGTGEPYATVKVSISEELFTGSVNEDGTFSVAIPYQVPGTEIVVTLTDAAGNESLPTTVIVKNSDVTAPEAPFVNSLNDRHEKVTGTGEPGAAVVVAIGSEAYQGKVNDDGIFSVEIPRQEPDTVISVVLIDGAGNMSEATEVTVIEATISFYHVPENLAFKPTVIEPGVIRVPRNDPEWSLTIIDTRGPGSGFRVLAEAEQPLTTIDGTHRLPDSLVFVDENNNSFPLTNGPIEVYSGHTDQQQMTSIKWSEDQGPLIEVNAGNARAKSYETTITWTLVDAP
ncbi:Ig-like domain-containing protein [Bhargavaea ginsengi]|uniref:Ig-like domain-containing protein n=1 Tax=Bhargavaea ginsengi TaxID=426757 RepID=UPI00203AFCDF|nr:Ig-like domain-containing protein [Bhargavaea ginsengi]MCM3087529.1 Ig-like domain-containing protein [Bhargavaea ginsengi]